MRKILLGILILATMFLTRMSIAYAETKGTSGTDNFKVSVKHTDAFAKGFEGYEENRETPQPINEVSGDASAAVKLIHFQEHRDPNDTRARLQKGGSVQPGTYCLATNNKLGVLSLVPPDWGDGSDTPYNTRQGTLGCVPLTPEELEAAGFETAEVDGQTVLRVTQVVLSVEDFNTFPVTPAQAHQERAPHTLKNYNTNFWADPNPQEFTRTIAGQEVALRAIPVSYTFNYGDGTTLGPVSYPGYQLGEEVWDQPTDTSHKYTEPGDYEFTITTSYRGEYSVNGGPWQVIDGTVERTTDPQLVRVWRVKAGLVADDCEQNPRAWGCPGA